MSVLAVSITTVALAEIGDKTQLLSLLLASRYRKPLPIILAIFLATVANHALAAWLGVVVADYLTPEALKWVLVASFVLMAGWILIPDKLDDDEKISSRGPFIASFIAFFVAEIGDKTQVATTMLGAKYHDGLVLVVLGTTIGMPARQCACGADWQAFGRSNTAGIDPQGHRLAVCPAWP